MGEIRSAREGEDGLTVLAHAVVMDTAAIDLIRESGQLQMLITPALVGSTLSLAAVVLTGWPGRVFLAVQTRLAVSRDVRRTA